MKFDIEVEVDHWLEGNMLVTALNDGIRQRQSIYDLIFESYSYLEEIMPDYNETIELDDLKADLEDSLAYVKALQERAE